MMESKRISVKKCPVQIVQSACLFVFTLCLIIGALPGTLSPSVAAVPHEKNVAAARPHKIEGLHSGGIIGSENIREFKTQIRTLRPDNQKSKAGFSYTSAVLCDTAYAILITIGNAFHGDEAKAVRPASLRTQKARAPPLTVLS